ncbi:WD40-repeat-containing domain protein [Dactylonectria estremocensis]|uniref:WD40-repeat-containing domain protein n=1 Tax=Dactylonectria estremocensis TaxID=1079267 RepID=A0A9P9JCC9_9HYPO|nr:WD40-repeat-containing domain protein [Dactylonectria estremocensis]
MAGSKSTRTKDDQTKKRKRELAEADSRSKRLRAERKENKANGRKSVADLLNPLNGAQSEQNGLSSALQTTGDRALEVIPQFDNAEAGWRVSKPMGGRMLDIDPILTEDDQYLILAYNTSIQIYSAVDSLLVRRIPITVVESSAQKASASATIVATRLSKQNPHFVWVACSDGRVFHVDWTSSKIPESFQTRSGTAKALVVLTTKISKTTEEVLLITESEKSNRMEVVAYEGKTQSTSEPKVIMTMKKAGNGLQLLELSDDDQVLVGAINDHIFVGVPLHQNPDSLAGLEFELYSFDVPDLVTALDIRVHARPATTSKKARSEPAPVVDIIVGGARGSIYLYNDVLARSLALGKSGSDKETIQAQKYHWHRKAVHALKWSRDGHYMISGGSENSLVLWQLDTSRKDFLPHLSGSVENIVVSATGSSYVIHLDDNSTMILSTAEMKPTAYIAGIQSAAVHVSSHKDLVVQRTWTAPDSVRRPIPAAIRPTDHSRLHVCVGNSTQASSSGHFSAPLLQTFDLETFRSVSRQALARTQPTDVNITNKGNLIDEPLITHLAFSADGEWLASVDTWEPSSRDVDNVLSDLKDQFIQERREVYLKFWEARQGDDQIALVSRINAPHATTRNEAVLDLASNPVSTCFATVGTDGLVRLWRPKTRSQNGVVVKGADGREVFTWSCSQVIAVGEGQPQEGTVDLPEPTAGYEPQGSLTFSEDGSTLFVAFGIVGSGAVYVVDAASGEIVKTLEGQWKGQLRSVRALSPFVIVLSDELRVYDVVSDELRYGVVIPKGTGSNDLLQLAVDHTSGHFAVALPSDEGSTLGVFEPEESEPLLVRSTPQKIISLVSSPDTSGFIALDDAAQVWVVAEGSDASSLATVQPLEDLRLEDAGALDNGVLIDEDEDEDMGSEGEEDTEQHAFEEDIEMEDDDVHPRVVHQQHLADIFDAAPAFAAPPIEDMFYKVTGLLATKPLAASS